MTRDRSWLTIGEQVYWWAADETWIGVVMPTSPKVPMDEVNVMEHGTGTVRTISGTN